MTWCFVGWRSSNLAPSIMGRPVVQIHYLQLITWEVVQLVEHWSPKPAVVGSTPAFSAIMGMSSNWSGSYSDKVVMKVQVLTCPL